MRASARSGFVRGSGVHYGGAPAHGARSGAKVSSMMFATARRRRWRRDRVNPWAGGLGKIVTVRGRSSPLGPRLPASVGMSAVLAVAPEAGTLVLVGHTAAPSAGNGVRMVGPLRSDCGPLLATIGVTSGGGSRCGRVSAPLVRLISIGVAFAEFQRSLPQLHTELCQEATARHAPIIRSPLREYVDRLGGGFTLVRALFDVAPSWTGVTTANTFGDLRRRLVRFCDAPANAGR